MLRVDTLQLIVHHDNEATLTLYRRLTRLVPCRTSPVIQTQHIQAVKYNNSAICRLCFALLLNKNASVMQDYFLQPLQQCKRMQTRPVNLLATKTRYVTESFRFPMVTWIKPVWDGRTSGTRGAGQANKPWPENTKGTENTNNLKMYLKYRMNAWMSKTGHKNEK